MTFKRYCVVLGLIGALVLSGCQTNSGTDENSGGATEETAVEQAQSESEQEEGEDDHDEEFDFSEGFESPELALDVYMEEIVHKDFDKAYEALHELDKEAFTVEDFMAYQKAFQSAKDIHGYAIHDEQSYKRFEFLGMQFEEVVFYDLDYAFVDVGEEPPAIDEDQDHGHDHSSDYTSHDHGHNMATMGLAVVKRNGHWFVLQGLSQYEMQDLTRKYTNQGISLNLDEKENYLIGDSVSVGNMIFSVNEVTKDETRNTYILEVALMNAGFDPIDTSHFINKFALKDANTSNFMSEKSQSPDALGGLVRSGSFTKGLVEIPVKDTFEADAVYFLMNTIDPSKPPVRIEMEDGVEPSLHKLYDEMVRKESVRIGQDADLEGVRLNVKSTTLKPASNMAGYELLSIDLEIKNTSDEKLYVNQVDLTVRADNGVAQGLSNQLKTEILDPGQSLRETVQATIMQGVNSELTLHVNNQTPNNNATVQLNK